MDWPARRSERLLMGEIDYRVLFRWFVGMNMDEPVWDPTVFTKNRDRLLKHEVAKAFSCRYGIRPSSRRI
jgi:transposase